MQVRLTAVDPAALEHEFRRLKETGHAFVKNADRARLTEEFRLLAIVARQGGPEIKNASLLSGPPGGPSRLGNAEIGVRRRKAMTQVYTSDFVAPGDYEGHV
jgi:hypothetical protein